MKKYQGDLTDIITATIAGDEAAVEGDGGGFPMNFLFNPDEEFGDPFTYSIDPLIYDMDGRVSEFLLSSSLLKPPQVTPAPKPTGETKTPVTTTVSANSKRGSSDFQIPSPKITGIKRRKSQTKKVVCIPAPVPANIRHGGEVVPSDLWAWRKYGQKPIKGSPYPRGYYKCSSTKGCPARKQVERSRTDPNLLVITYAAEHNHPWPTQRNALAGTTRSQTPKSAAKKPIPPPSSPTLEFQFNNIKPRLPDSSLNLGEIFFADSTDILLLDPFMFHDGGTTSASHQIGELNPMHIGEK